MPCHCGQFDYSLQSHLRYLYFFKKKKQMWWTDDGRQTVKLLKARVSLRQKKANKVFYDINGTQALDICLSFHLRAYSAEAQASVSFGCSPIPLITNCTCGTGIQN